MRRCSIAVMCVLLAFHAAPAFPFEPGDGMHAEQTLLWCLQLSFSRRLKVGLGCLYCTNYTALRTIPGIEYTAGLIVGLKQFSIPYIEPHFDVFGLFLNAGLNIPILFEKEGILIGIAPYIGGNILSGLEVFAGGTIYPARLEASSPDFGMYVQVPFVSIQAAVGD